MKKFLLTLLVGFVGLISFSNAGLLSHGDFTYRGSKQNITVPGLQKIYVKSISKGNSNWIELTCPGLIYFSSLSVGQVINIPSSYDGVCEINPSGSANTVVLTLTYESPYVSEDGINGVFNGLTSTVNEFIPLMAQLGFGVLIAVIGFVAIKWLVNRLRKKVLSVFRKK